MNYKGTENGTERNFNIDVNTDKQYNKRRSYNEFVTLTMITSGTYKKVRNIYEQLRREINESRDSVYESINSAKSDVRRVLGNNINGFSRNDDGNFTASGNGKFRKDNSSAGNESNSRSNKGNEAVKFDVLDEENENETDCKNFKDKSRIIELPCKVGDTVYRVRRKPYTNKGYEIVEREVVSFGLRFRKGNPIWSIVTTAVDVFNKTVFLTRKQAEQVLKERENN